MRCAFCSSTVSDDPGTMIGAGWEYGYLTQDEEEIEEAVCPKCQAEHCDFEEETTTLYLKPGHENAAEESREREDLISRVRLATRGMGLDRLRTIALLLGA